MNLEERIAHVMRLGLITRPANEAAQAGVDVVALWRRMEREGRADQAMLDSLTDAQIAAMVNERVLGTPPLQP